MSNHFTRRKSDSILRKTLSLIAAGYQNAVAIFGVHGFDWGLVKADKVVFCLDQDAAGERWKELAFDGAACGKEVYWLPAEIYRGCNDLNEAWMTYRELSIEF